MFMQQFCGVNVIAYSSTAVFKDAGFGQSQALLISLGTGVEHLPHSLTVSRDNVFNVGNRQHAKYYTEKLPWHVNKHILRRDINTFEPLYHFAGPAAGKPRRASLGS